MVMLRDLMSATVTSTAPDTPVAAAAEAMVAARVGSVVVLVGGTLVGIFTERDVLRAAAGHGDLNAELVRDWMTPDPETAIEQEDSQAAIETMLAGGFRHLPVIEGYRVVGLVSLRDLLSTHIGRG